LGGKRKGEEIWLRRKDLGGESKQVIKKGDKKKGGRSPTKEGKKRDKNLGFKSAFYLLPISTQP